MKKIEINPEWILEEFPITHYADGNGKVIIETDEIIDARWIDLALAVLHIPYSCSEYYDEEQNTFSWLYTLSLNDLKDDCPTFFKKMNDLDNWNHAYKLKKYIDHEEENNL